MSAPLPAIPPFVMTLDEIIERDAARNWSETDARRARAILDGLRHGDTARMYRDYINASEDPNAAHAELMALMFGPPQEQPELARRVAVARGIEREAPPKEPPQ